MAVQIESKDDFFAQLELRSSSCECGRHVARLETIHRFEIYYNLVYERLERKHELLKSLFEYSYQDWNQTLYMMIMRTVGGAQNNEVFLELSRRIPYGYVLRERMRPLAVEAMMICCSGLIDFYPDDQYTLKLREEFAHLQAKYKLEPLSPKSWSLARIQPANHPILRLSQLSELFTKNDFLFAKVLSCTCLDDVRNIFCVEASEYWRTHSLPGVISNREFSKRVGSMMANILAINMVALMQYGYGMKCNLDKYREQALELLEHLPVEDNRYIRAWAKVGVVATNALESQALLQLSTCYCEQKRCRECVLGQRIWRAREKSCAMDCESDNKYLYL